MVGGEKMALLIDSKNTQKADIILEVVGLKIKTAGIASHQRVNSYIVTF